MKEKENAYIVGIRTQRQTREEALDSMQELKCLAESAGASVVGETFCDLERINPATFIGKGKAREIGSSANETCSDLVIFDKSLSPAQQRNLENLNNHRILDRTSLILDIFSQRAQTKEGKLQVELAQLKYLLPRLTRMWKHLSRLGAGIGTRGPGETQLEVDRRKIRQRIDKLSDELKKVRNRRRLQRSGRKKTGFTSIALVGYTNAGKSTLMNALTGSNALVQDKLFATLDPTIRILDLPNGRQVIVSDTVGFISNLPHQLVEAFRATLEEVVDADLLIHVIDATSENTNEQINAVNKVLHELNADKKPCINVYNKIDACNQWIPGQIRTEHGDNSFAISAKKQRGLAELIEAITHFENQRTQISTFRIPFRESRIAAEIHEDGEVISETFDEHAYIIRSRVPFTVYNRFENYIVEDDAE